MEPTPDSAFRVPSGYKLVEDKPKRPPPLTHREDAVKPFNSYEWSLISTYAPRLVWNLRSSVQRDVSGHWVPGFEVAPDPTFVWDTCLVLYGTAAHISALPKIRATDVWFDDKDSKWWRVNITRTKPNSASMRMVSPPIPDDFSPWIRAYFAKPKPRLGWSYNHMFNALSDLIERSTRKTTEGRDEPGIRLHINALRFRHAGAVRFKLHYNVTDEMAAKWAGCTVRTLQRYARAPDAEVLAAIRSRGQADSLFSGKVGV